MKKNKKNVPKKQALESQYTEIMKNIRPQLAYQKDLKQPHLHRYVDSVTTYGAYEEPI